MQSDIQRTLEKGEQILNQVEGMRKEEMQENIDANHVEWGFTEGWTANI